MKHTLTILLTVLLLCALCALIAAPAGAAGESPIGVTTTETWEPVTFVTPEPTTVMTTAPTAEPTTRETTEPTLTITLPTVEPTSVGGGKGYIDTYCNINGASVSFDGSYQCTIAQGICTVGVSPSGTPIRTITVSNPGYVTWTGSLPHMPADGEHIAVDAILNPVPTTTITIGPVQTGVIYAQSSPAGAAIYLNGNYYGYSPVTIPNLAPGSYSMKASLNGYTPDMQIVYVYAGQTATYYPVLRQSPQPPRSTGTVTITSNPGQALIYVDGSYVGKATLTVTLYPGSHTFRLSQPGYNDYTATIYVNANTNQNLNAVMTPAVYGTVAVTSLPGASVYMDSTNQGTIPPSGTLTLYNVANGNRLFKITATGYNDWLNSVYVQPNAVTPIYAVLSPAGTNPTPVQATGGFNIVSTPSGAEIFIDNLFQGYTPSMPTNIAPGQHQILLKYTGYLDYSTTASVISGQVTPLAISMQPAPTPTPASAPSLAVFIMSLAIVIGMCASIRRRS